MCAVGNESGRARRCDRARSGVRDTDADWKGGATYGSAGASNGVLPALHAPTSTVASTKSASIDAAPRRARPCKSLCITLRLAKPFASESEKRLKSSRQSAPRVRGGREGDRELKGTRSVVQGQRMASSTRGRHRFEHTLLIVLICASLARLAASPDTSDAGQGIRERGRGTDSATGAQGMAAYSGGRKEDALRLFAQVLFGYRSRG